LHVPTVEKNEEIKDKFYYDLETIIMKCPKNDVEILLVILMPKENQEKAVLGKYGLHSNDNGLRLIGLANMQNVVFSSTTFLHKNIHSTT
jgi:hypothetical protein